MDTPTESSEERVAKKALTTMPDSDVPNFNRPIQDAITGVKASTSTLEATQRNFAEKGIVKPAFGEALTLAAKVTGTTQEPTASQENTVRPK